MKAELSGGGEAPRQIAGGPVSDAVPGQGNPGYQSQQPRTGEGQ
jgi:hypothetical protein